MSRERLSKKSFKFTLVLTIIVTLSFVLPLVLSAEEEPTATAGPAPEAVLEPTPEPVPQPEPQPEPAPEIQPAIEPPPEIQPVATPEQIPGSGNIIEPPDAQNPYPHVHEDPYIPGEQPVYFPTMPEVNPPEPIIENSVITPEMSIHYWPEIRLPNDEVIGIGDLPIIPNTSDPPTGEKPVGDWVLLESERGQEILNPDSYNNEPVPPNIVDIQPPQETPTNLEQTDLCMGPGCDPYPHGPDLTDPPDVWRWYLDNPPPYKPEEPNLRYPDRPNTPEWQDGPVIPMPYPEDMDDHSTDVASAEYPGLPDSDLASASTEITTGTEIPTLSGYLPAATTLDNYNATAAVTPDNSGAAAPESTPAPEAVASPEATTPAPVPVEISTPSIVETTAPLGETAAAPVETQASVETPVVTETPADPTPEVVETAAPAEIIAPAVVEITPPSITDVSTAPAVLETPTPIITETPISYNPAVVDPPQPSGPPLIMDTPAYVEPAQPVVENPVEVETSQPVIKQPVIEQPISSEPKLAVEEPVSKPTEPAIVSTEPSLENKNDQQLPSDQYAEGPATVGTDATVVDNPASGNETEEPDVLGGCNGGGGDVDPKDEVDYESLSLLERIDLICTDIHDLYTERANEIAAKGILAILTNQESWERDKVEEAIYGPAQDPYAYDPNVNDSNVGEIAMENSDVTLPEPDVYAEPPPQEIPQMTAEEFEKQFDEQWNRAEEEWNRAKEEARRQQEKEEKYGAIDNAGEWDVTGTIDSIEINGVPIGGDY